MSVSTQKKERYERHDQESAYASPWSRKERLRMLGWGIAWSLLCKGTPKPFNTWRLFWLKRFGCTIYGKPFVHQKAQITKPWNLILHDRACLGEGAVAYTLGEIEIKARATIAQEVYLCTGSHDFSHADIPLVTAKITIEEDAFVGARAFVLPGITIGEGGVIGAASVVTHSTPKGFICAGNPCKPLKYREVRESL